MKMVDSLVLLHESLDSFPTVEEIPTGQILNDILVRLYSVRSPPLFRGFTVHFRGK